MTVELSWPPSESIKSAAKSRRDQFVKRSLCCVGQFGIRVGALAGPRAYYQTHLSLVGIEIALVGQDETMASRLGCVVWRKVE